MQKQHWEINIVYTAAAESEEYNIRARIKQALIRFIKSADEKQKNAQWVDHQCPFGCCLSHHHHHCREQR
jgi:hypothetical protein